MQTLYDVLVWVHVASWAVVLLGYLKDVRGPKVNAWMAHGLSAAFIFGVALAGIASMSEDVADPNNAKIGVKLVIAFIAVGLAHSTRKKPTPNPMAHVIAALVLVNVALAYLW